MRPLALGLASAVASRLFGFALPSLLEGWARTSDPEQVKTGVRSFQCEPFGSASSTRVAIASRRERVLLERICAAFNKAEEDRAGDGLYEATMWWSEVKQKHLAPVTDALRACDIERLGRMYRDFFRNSCGKGLVRRPPGAASDSDGRLLLDEEALRLLREDALYRIAYWRVETAGRYPLSVLSGNAVGNPFGATLDGVFIPAAAEYQHACADRIRQFVGEGSTVVELGGGFGHMASFLLAAGPRVTYIDFDTPESLALAAYYIGQSLPEKRLLLYGERDFHAGCAADFDAVFLPSWRMTALAAKSVDLTFSSHLFADLQPEALDAYVEQVARFTRGPVLHVTHESSAEGREKFLRTMSSRLRHVQMRRWDWNLHRAPDAKEWEDLYWSEPSL